MNWMRAALVAKTAIGVRADTAFVTPHDPMRVVCTGDWVAVEPAGTPRYVRTYLPRRTAFVRSTSSKRSEGQILAANVDHAIVAVSLAVELDLGRIERFLALAWESGASRAAEGGTCVCRSRRWAPAESERDAPGNCSPAAIEDPRAARHDSRVPCHAWMARPG